MSTTDLPLRHRAAAPVLQMMAGLQLAALVVVGRPRLHEFGFLEHATGRRLDAPLAWATISAAGEIDLLETDVQCDDETRLGQLLADHAARSGPVRVGVVGPGAVVAAALGEHVVDVTASYAAVKAARGPRERKGVRSAAKLADAALLELARVANLGWTAWEVQLHVERWLEAAGGRHPLVRLRDTAPFAAASPPTALERNRVYTAYVEVANAGGYWAETMRPVVIGTPDAGARRMLGIGRTLRRAAEPLLCAGAVGGVVASTLIELAISYGGELNPKIGHAVGIDDHDPPRLQPGDGDTLAVGMTIALHPSFILPSGDGLTIGDTFEITTERPLVMSTVPWDAFVGPVSEWQMDMPKALVRP